MLRFSPKFISKMKNLIMILFIYYASIELGVLLIV